MDRHWTHVVTALVVALAATLTLGSCGGGGGSSGGGGSQAQLSVVFKDVTAGVSGTVLMPPSKTPGGATNLTGEAGSKVESMQAQVNSFELQKNDNSWVTVYSSTGYVEFVGSSGRSVTDTLVGTLPPAGAYKAFRLTATGIKIKMKLVQGGTTYYTTRQTITGGSSQPWAFTTNPANYDYLTYNFSPVSVFQSDFPTPLTVTTTSITLYHVLQRAGTISCDGGTVNVDVTYCSEDNISEGILPASPATMAQFEVTATTSSATPPTRSNTITAYFGGQDNFLGATVYRPAYWYFNGSTMTTGTGSYSSSTRAGSVNVTFMDGDGIQDGTYNLTAGFNCSGRTFSGLVITPTGTGTSIYNTDYTLQTSGPATCTAF